MVCCTLRTRSGANVPPPPPSPSTTPSLAAAAYHPGSAAVPHSPLVSRPPPSTQHSTTASARSTSRASAGSAGGVTFPFTLARFPPFPSSLGRPTCYLRLTVPRCTCVFWRCTCTCWLCDQGGGAGGEGGCRRRQVYSPWHRRRVVATMGAPAAFGHGLDRVQLGWMQMRAVAAVTRRRALRRRCSRGGEQRARPTRARRRAWGCSARTL